MTTTYIFYFRLDVRHASRSDYAYAFMSERATMENGSTHHADKLLCHFSRSTHGPQIEALKNGCYNDTDILLSTAEGTVS